MPVAPGDFLEVVSYCRLGEQTSLNVWHYNVASVVAASVSEEDIAAALDTTFGPLFKDAMSSSATYRGLSVQKIAPVPVGDKFFSVAEAGPGTEVADPLPGQVAGLISLRTGIAGRASRGRKYIAFMPESWNGIDGNPSAAALVALGDLGSKFVLSTTVSVGADSATINPVILNLDTETSYALESYLVRNKWATQRRRSAINRGDSSPV